MTNTYKPILNGIVASMEALRTFLEAEGHEVVILAPRFPGYEDADPVVRRFPSITPPAKVRFPVALPITPSLFREIAELQVDLFHAHHPFALGASIQRVAARLGRPMVATIHTQYERYLHYVPLPQTVVRPVVRRMVARFCDACQCITTPAAGMAEVIRSYGVRRPVTVVPNGVDVRRYREAQGGAVRQRLGISADEVIALFSGRLAPEKNLPELLEAARLVVQRQPGFRLVLLGDGPELPALRRRAAEPGLKSCVRFAGAVPHEEVPPFCAAADLFVTASTSEVNPTSIIEAMAAGTPVVAYDTFGAREIVQPGEHGLLTEHTPAALAAALDALVRDGARRAQMAASAARHAERFSLEVTGRQMLAVYEQACASLNAVPAG